MRSKRRKKAIACFFLVIFTLQLLLPISAHALTNGPSQPEMQKFEPAGAGNMVDLFSGDFKYNIPLIDVDGYPVNLAYGSESGIEDESSWVGMGWTLNPGAINRSMRGLPDDFNGNKDFVTKEYNRKEFKKIGGQFIIKPSLFGWEIGKASIKVGVYKDNYYGIGAELGASVGFQLAKNMKTPFTASLGLDVNSDSRKGVSISPSLSLGMNYDANKEISFTGLSGGFSYNNRAGLSQLSLSASFSSSKLSKLESAGLELDQPSISYTRHFGQSVTPFYQTNTSNEAFTFNFDGGPSFWGIYAGLGASGYFYREKILQPVTKAPAYGYMNYVNGRKNPNALLDFNREKDGVFLTSSPAIPIPVATQDYFMATGQMGSLQFRPHFSGNYVVFDKAHRNISTEFKAGVTIGWGNLKKFGARFDIASGDAHTNKWVDNNQYLEKAEPVFSNLIYPLEEAVYLKQTGEHTMTDKAFLNNILDDQTQQVTINDRLNRFAKATTKEEFKTRDGRVSIQQAIKKTTREKRSTAISYLNAEQAAKYGLNKTINGEQRVIPGHREAHHISEMTVTDNSGNRMIYGIPVYNMEQREVSFSINGLTPGSTLTEETRRTGLVQYNSGDNSRFNTQGRDHLFSRETLPPYATSFLLTGILSPDYVDLEGDGITDDDLGTAIKFNYEKTSANYQWRTPYDLDKANYNEGFISDVKDDKASYVYGKKELWYLKSIESKTMIAFFDVSNREDGLGVGSENGGLNSQQASRVKKLDKIRLYSKADWIKNGVNAIPVKTVHFEYDYSLYPGVANNTGVAVNVNGGEVQQGQVNVNAAKGKLTLKKLYYTFGNNTRGQFNPYGFEYDMRLVNTLPGVGVSNDPKEAADEYTSRQQDRWGAYKQSWFNRKQGSIRKLNNSEFPYVIQKDDDPALDERDLANRLASKWQLNRITTPTGSIINIEYEADDYAFVQNRRAMQMCFVTGVGNSIGTGNDGLINAGGLSIQLPVAITPGSLPDMREDFERLYLRGADGKLLDKIFYKVYTRMTKSENIYEYVHGYGEIIPLQYTFSQDGKTVFLPLKKIESTNPIAKASWQMLKADLPHFAYDNYDNSDSESFFSDLLAAIKSLAQAARNVAETFTSFERSARAKYFGDKADLGKSMVRLYNPDFYKIGGGSRVKKVTINDDWNNMTGQVGQTAVYGQSYEYEIKSAGGQKISSGVAAYEPAIGNEENPFHEPVNFVEKVHWSADRYHYIEKPFCESYFPAATVGYSKVTVTPFGDNHAQGGQDLQAQEGYTENEFYTARDFPTQVDNMTLDQVPYETKLSLNLFASTYVKRHVTSQGFKVVLNDMHGKSRSVKVFNKNGDLQTSTENFYSVVNQESQEKELNNNADVLLDNGAIENRLIATDVDLVTDVRESHNQSIGTSIGGYGGSFFIGWFPIPYGAVNANASVMADSYNSISTVKVIQQYGVLKKVLVNKNGSSIFTENLLWDGETGETLLTRTQNEFDDYTYAFSYPAYRAEGHDGMGGAYKNTGAVIVSIASLNGSINPIYYNPASPVIVPGDELISLGIPKKGWVIKSGTTLRLVDANGEFLSANGIFMVLRSGRRNITSGGVGSIVCQNNPIITENGVRKLRFSTGNRILDAKAVMYKDEWAMPIPKKSELVTQCTPELLAEIEGAGNYFLDNTSVVTCKGDFTALRTSPARIGRSFLNFADVTAPRLNGVPDDATIISAKLRLYPITPGAQAAAYLKRVTEARFCDPPNNNPNWNSQASVTDAHQVLMPTIAVPPASHEIDVTAMFNEWFTTRDVSMFIIRISLVNEAFVGQAAFYGVEGTGAPAHEKIPTLEICYSIEEDCMVDPVGKVINPYVNGILGNWRADRSFVYTVPRDQKPGQASQPGGTDIRRSGSYSSFDPFWIFQAGNLHSTVQVEPIVPSQRWIWSERSIYYDQKGNETENVDAIDRYSSALFGYRESATTAVAVNARRNEIAFDGFEDYYFSLQSNLQEKCPLYRHFDWGFQNTGGIWSSSSGSITTAKAHSGKYSYALTGTTTLLRQAGSATPPASVLGYDASGRYILTNNDLAKGFAPVPGKQYLLSMWVNETETQVTNKISKLQVSINGQDHNVNLIVVPVVEGWKRLELTFTAGTDFSLNLIPTGTVWIDDVRILPHEGQMSSFVYDDRSMRLLAQLDENNFATFFEYDDEGTPVRVKKETERGIMTLKENRQSFRKRN